MWNGGAPGDVSKVRGIAPVSAFKSALGSVPAACYTPLMRALYVILVHSGSEGPLCDSELTREKAMLVTLQISGIFLYDSYQCSSCLIFGPGAKTC